jgi:predicted RNA-binding Zn ribbon-like protein
LRRGRKRPRPLAQGIRAGDCVARDALSAVRRPDAGKPATSRDLEALNQALAQAPARRALRRGRGGYEWEVNGKSGTALALLAPILWSAGDLLAGPRLDRVRRCANPECGWLFLDDSRAGKRRWCSMSACGNRAKARRHYHKSKEE